LAQDRGSLGGKILRLTPDGEPAPGNSFDGEVKRFVYSYGHRNPEGLAFDEEGRLYATEHGSVGHDEVNLIENGGNYGWPLHTGAPGEPGFVDPVVHSGSDTWAPAGATIYNGPIEEWRGSMFFGGLRGEALRRLEVDGTEAGEHEALLKGKFGRIRAVATGPNGGLYFSTSNRNGRGDPARSDDRVIRIVPRGDDS